MSAARAGLTVASGTALFEEEEEEEEEDPPMNEVLPSIVLPAAEVESLELEESGDPVVVGLLLSVGRPVSEIGVGVTTVVVVFVLFSPATLESGELASSVVLLLSSAGGLVTVVSFFWQPTPNKPTPTITQTYFFIKRWTNYLLISLFDYGLGEGEVVVVVVDSVEAGLVNVVVSVIVPLGLAAGVTVSVFCSQAASSAAPAKMQMYFFIG